MGFKQRERKRLKKAAMESNTRTIRRRPKESTNWWLTVVREHTCCARCSGQLRAGREMVYRHTPRESLCLSCAEKFNVKFRPSLRWERDAAKKLAKKKTNRGIAKGDEEMRAA